MQNPDMPYFAKSVDPDQLTSSEANWSGSALFVINYVKLLKKPTDLDLHCLSLNMWISIKNSDQVIWLAGN